LKSDANVFAKQRYKESIVKYLFITASLWLLNIFRELCQVGNDLLRYLRGFGVVVY
jgi:hypothetical protein